MEECEITVMIRQMMAEYEEEMIRVMKHLHQHPELSMQEYATTAFIRGYLRDLDIEILDIGTETGVVGLLRGTGTKERHIGAGTGECKAETSTGEYKTEAGAGECKAEAGTGQYNTGAGTDGKVGPCVALRADIDALPIEELSDCGYRSMTPGCMHACGHDFHTAALLGAARMLAALRDEIQGSVKFIFQPGEEMMLGAKLMIEHGVLEHPKVDAIFGMHNVPEYPTGTVCVKNGPLMASVDRFEIRIHGHGGHGGIPQDSADPVMAAAAVIQAVQTIVSRNVSPLDTAVVSICSMQAGDRYNVIPDEAVLSGTVRAYKKEVQELVERRLQEIVRSVSAGYGCRGELKYTYELGATVNDPGLYEIARTAAQAVGEPVEPVPSAGGEDFSEYTRAGVPAFLYWMGVRNEAQGCCHSWHSPQFKADPEALKYAAGTYAVTALLALQDLSAP